MAGSKKGEYDEPVDAIRFDRSSGDRAKRGEYGELVDEERELIKRPGLTRLTLWRYIDKMTPARWRTPEEATKDAAEKIYGPDEKGRLPNFSERWSRANQNGLSILRADVSAAKNTLRMGVIKFARALNCFAPAEIPIGGRLSDPATGNLSSLGEPLEDTPKKSGEVTFGLVVDAEKHGSTYNGRETARMPRTFEARGHVRDAYDPTAR